VHSHKEKHLSPEFTLQLAEVYAETFIHRRDCYPLQLDKGNYVTIKKSLKPEMVMAHIKGTITLGAYALDENSTARWLCFDADDEGEWEQLHHLATTLNQQNIPTYLECSRRGGHLWLFTPPLSGKTMRQFGKQLLKEHDLDKNIELYPKQNTLSTGVGSLVRLPLGIHRKTGKRYHFITLQCEPLAPTIREQLALLSHPERVPDRFIQQILANIAITPPPKPHTFADVVDRGGERLSERIKGSISVLDFVDRYVPGDEHGRGFCPFHDDEHQSFGVHEGRNFWHCYAGCGGGSVIDFWMKWREVHGLDASFTATITELAHLLFGK
jgi:hypothetical protein